MGHTTGSVGINTIVLSIGVFLDTPDSRNIITNAREVEMDDKLVFCTLANGSFEIFSLATKCSIVQSSSGSWNLTTILYSPSHKLLSTGSSHGVINMYNAASLKNLSSSLISWSSNASSIEDVAFLLSPSSSAAAELEIGTDDILPYITTISHDSAPNVKVKAEIVGGDYKGVRIVRVGEEEVWTAGDDSVVRAY